jgi:hypothetical protein
MARVDLHNFFKFYDDRNPNHVKAVQWMEDNFPNDVLNDSAEWAEIYRGKKSSSGSSSPSAAPSGDVCPHCGKSLGK